MVEKKRLIIGRRENIYIWKRREYLFLVAEKIYLFDKRREYIFGRGENIYLVEERIYIW